MKLYITAILLITFQLMAISQEMESTIFNEDEIQLNFAVDSAAGGSSRIHLERKGDNNQAAIQFQYRDIPFSIGDQITGEISSWNMGVIGQPDSIGDFTLTNNQLYFDLLLYRTDLTVRSDNGYVGIGTYHRPKAKLKVEHFPSDRDDAALSVGEDCRYCGYVNINQPGNDEEINYIAKFGQNSGYTTYINDEDAPFQLSIYDNIFANGGLYTGPIFTLSKSNVSASEASNLINKLEPKSGYKSNGHSLSDKGYDLDISNLEKLFPALVKRSTNPDKTKKDNIGINYQGLIPVMVAAHQETTTQLATAKEEITDLKLRLEKLEALLR